VGVGPSPTTRFPTVTSALLTRPAMGERTWVNSRLRRAVCTAASAARMLASVSPWAATRSSYSRLAMALSASSRSARASSVRANPARVWAPASAASARANSAW